MSVQRAVSVLLAAVLLAGCGDRRLILKVDVLSFLNPSQTTQSFDVFAGVGGLWFGEQTLVDDLSVNLFEGLGSATQIQSVTVTAMTVWTVTSGSGADTVRVYLSDVNTPPRNTPAAIVLPVTLAAGTTDTVRAVLGDDPRIAALFGQKKVRLSVTNSLRGPLIPPLPGINIVGSVSLRELDAVAIAVRKP